MREREKKERERVEGKLERLARAASTFGNISTLVHFGCSKFLRGIKPLFALVLVALQLFVCAE
jgi:hypothetical protein